MIWQRPYSRENLSLPDEPILSERLSLREVREDDLPSLWLLDSDPEVMKYIRPPSTDKEAFMAEHKKDLEAGERFKFFRLITLKKTDKPIGWLLLRPTEDQKWVEVGYRVLKNHWGKGYAPEACRTIIDLAFSKWGLKEVIAVLMKDNEKSAKTAEKIGLTYQGQRQEFYDMDLAFYLLENKTAG